MEKPCDQWEGMQVGQKNWQAFKDHFEQAYWRYHICKKATAAAHEYGASANHAHEIYTHVMTEYALQALANVTM